MVGGKDLDSLKVKAPSAEGSDFGICLKKCLRGKGSQRTNDFGVNGLNLLHQESRTALDFIGLWVPILRGAAFDDIGDIDLLPREMDRLNNPG